MSKLVLFFFLEDFKNVHLRKDVGLFPIYLKRYFSDVEIKYVECNTKNIIPLEYRGVKVMPFCKLKNIKRGKFSFLIQQRLIEEKIKKYIKKDTEVTHVMLFHWTISHLRLISELKKLNPNIKVYLKMDTTVSIAKNIVNQCLTGKSRVSFLYRKSIINGMKSIDLITAESKDVIDILCKNSLFKEKTFFAPNGYDDDLFKAVKKAEKQKIIITVGRLGTEQKNTELFLKIISNVDLSEYKVLLVGPIEASFKNYIDQFYLGNEVLKDKVEFLNNIEDPKILLDLYSRSSIFMFTSRWESSGLVLLEAAINGCYILSTDVGAINEISGTKKYCWICPNSKNEQQKEIDMELAFTKKLQEIIHNDELCLVDLEERQEYYKNTYLMSKIIDAEWYRKWAR